MKQKTTVQLVDEALARLGCKRLHIEPAAPPKPAMAKRRSKPSGNGARK